MKHIEIKSPSIYLGVISRVFREFPDEFNFDYSESIESAYKRAAEIINSKIKYDIVDTADENSECKHSLTLVRYCNDIGILVNDGPIEVKGNFVSENPEENYYFSLPYNSCTIRRVEYSEINKGNGNTYFVGLFTVFNSNGQKILVIEDINCENE